MHRHLSGLLDLLLPRLCAECGCSLEIASALCGTCRGALSAAPLAPLAPRPLASLSCGTTFEGDAERWIRRFKYPARGLAGLDPTPRAVVEQLVCEAAALAPDPLPQLVVPVPLHPVRLRQRGFSPAGLLAQAVARQAGLACNPVALRRLRDTPSQTGLDRGARGRNVRGAFASCCAAPARVWLVDDVATTGSTLAECARTLRRAGAEQVLGVCAAHTPL